MTSDQQEIQRKKWQSHSVLGRLVTGGRASCPPTRARALLCDELHSRDPTGCIEPLLPTDREGLERDGILAATE